MYNIALVSLQGLCYYIFRRQTDVCTAQTSKYKCTPDTDRNKQTQTGTKAARHFRTYSTKEIIGMNENTYYLVKKRALPEVLLKVAEAKSLVESEKVMSIQEAVDYVGISRSSFYKYKDDISRFHDNTQGQTITLTFGMDDRPGLLAELLNILAAYGVNILTIHQSIPINALASLSISVQVLDDTTDVAAMIEDMERKEGVHHVKLLAKQ